MSRSSEGRPGERGMSFWETMQAGLVAVVVKILSKMPSHAVYKPALVDKRNRASLVGRFVLEMYRSCPSNKVIFMTRMEVLSESASPHDRPRTCELQATRSCKLQARPSFTHCASFVPSILDHMDLSSALTAKTIEPMDPHNGHDTWY